MAEEERKAKERRNEVVVENARDEAGYGRGFLLVGSSSDISSLPYSTLPYQSDFVSISSNIASMTPSGGDYGRSYCHSNLKPCLCIFKVKLDNRHQGIVLRSSKWDCSSRLFAKPCRYINTFTS